MIHDLTKAGGIMLPELPGGGMPTHGVVSYNPQFFWLLCRFNNCEVFDLTIVHAGDASLSNDVVLSNAQFARSRRAVQTPLVVPISSSPRCCRSKATKPTSRRSTFRRRLRARNRSLQVR